MSAQAARKHDPEASRAAILDAAEGLFLERGFAATSMSEIAERSGVTKSLIHHHFGSKESLWSEIKRRRFTSYHASQLALYERGLSADTIRASMATYFRFLLDNPQVVRMIGWMRLEGDLECADLVCDLRARGLQLIGTAQAAGLIRNDMPPEHVLLMFLGLVNAYFDEAAFVTDGNGAGLEPEAYVANAQKAFEAAMRPAP